jgi:outer membrane protein assembly factor BamE (lipoprotein component of BamABCDE complex)
MNRLLSTSLGLLALCASSCFLSRTTLNEPVHREEVDRFVPGTTTAKEVVASLGAPSEVVQLGSRTAYRYEFTVQKTAGFSIIIVSFVNNDTCSDRVWLFFDAKDVLTHAGTTLQAADAKFDMPWDPAHAPKSPGGG